MGHYEMFAILGVFALIFGSCTAEPENASLIRNTDRSVYARRSFALPDVVSDVYEVYVGPSVLRENAEREATAVIHGQSEVQGTITFKQMHPNDPVIVEGSLSGLAPGLHGFHIHQKGDLRNGCASAGSHFNPFGQQHGAPMDRNRHVGDLGNINAGPSGVATFAFSDSLISLSGINSIVGRTVLVHQKPDDVGKGADEESKKTGNAGARIACGVIGLA